MAYNFENDELVIKAQAGDQKAFALLFTLYRARLTRLVHRFTRNQSEAEDVVQDTFMRAYRALKSFRRESSFYTWLCRIALNRIKSNIHSRQLSQSTLLEYIALHGVDYESVRTQDLDTPEAIMIGKESAEAAEIAIEQLPGEFRTAFLLREVDGLSYATIAARMGSPIGTVRSRIARARELIDMALMNLNGDVVHRSIYRRHHEHGVPIPVPEFSWVRRHPLDD